MNLRLDRFHQNHNLFAPIEACNEILQYYEIQSREKGLYMKKIINHDARNKLARVAGDRQRFQQILLNIVQNSVKFTYYGGVEIFIDFENNPKFSKVK